MAKCPFVESCKLYPLFRLQASLKTWQIRYCEGEYATCERYRRARRGELVPPEVLPNGKMLPLVTKPE